MAAFLIFSLIPNPPVRFVNFAKTFCRTIPQRLVRFKLGQVHLRLRLRLRLRLSKLKAQHRRQTCCSWPKEYFPFYGSPRIPRVILSPSLKQFI